MNNVYIQIGDELLDVDDDTKIGFSYKSKLLFQFNISAARSFDLSVPATVKNNKIFAFDEVAMMSGVRQSMEATLLIGGIVLNGRLYLTDYSGGRYNILFVFGYVSDVLDYVPTYIFRNDNIYIREKGEPVQNGTIPDFGFYRYGNTVFDGSIGSPATIYPVANLGYLIDSYADELGYSVNYPDPDLGRAYQADAYGLVLPQMSTHTYANIIVKGSGVGGWTVTQGGTLQSAGLHLVTKSFKRGIYGAKKTVYCFEALRPLKVVMEAGTNVVAISGNGYTKFNDWNGRLGCTIELNTGDYFCLSSKDDWAKIIGKHYWRNLINPGETYGYESEVEVPLVITELSSEVVAGAPVCLMNCLPSDLTLKQLLDAYCYLICAVWYEDNGIIAIEPLDEYRDVDVSFNLAEYKIVEISSIKRYIDGWAQNNYIDCKTAEGVPEDMRFIRNIPVNNDYLDKERTIATIPFNEGEWYGDYDEKLAFIDNVQLSGQGDVIYAGVLSIIRENLVTDGALHIQTVIDEGVGSQYTDILRNATTIEVSFVFPFHLFYLYIIKEGERYGTVCKIMLYNKVAYIDSAEWGDGICRATLIIPD